MIRTSETIGRMSGKHSLQQPSLQKRTCSGRVSKACGRPLNRRTVGHCDQKGFDGSKGEGTRRAKASHHALHLILRGLCHLLNVSPKPCLPSRVLACFPCGGLSLCFPAAMKSLRPTALGGEGGNPVLSFYSNVIVANTRVPLKAHPLRPHFGELFWCLGGLLR